MFFRDGAQFFLLFLVLGISLQSDVFSQYNSSPHVKLAELTANLVVSAARSIDADEDGYSNGDDNCPGDPNPYQEPDPKRQGFGLACNSTIIVPKLEGLKYPDALKAILDVGLNVGNITQAPKSENELSIIRGKESRVIHQLPPGGAKVGSRARINLKLK